MITKLLVCALLAAAVPLAGIARADSQDDQFVAAVSAQGIPGDPAQLIGEGRAACDNYGGLGLAGQMSGLMARGMTNVQAQNVILDGMKAYCPEKAGGVPLP